MSGRYLITRIMMICIVVSVPGCISQDTDGGHYIDTGTPIKIKVNDFFTTDEYFYEYFYTIFAVAISPDGSHVAFSNRLHQLFILPNPPEERNAQSIMCLTPHYSCISY